jgi:hypothetical protein
MAKASFVTSPKPNVILELTFAEAQVVHLISGRIGGVGGIRPQSNAVYDALSLLLEEKDKLPRTVVSGHITIQETL